jgi:predicted AAA+ superfamily ATPase
LHYWRTKDRAEVDFVIRCGDKTIPVEVKYKRSQKLKIEPSLRSFINKYKPPTAYIVTLDFEDSSRFEETNVFFIPFRRLYSLDITADVPALLM